MSFRRSRSIILFIVHHASFDRVFCSNIFISQSDVCCFIADQIPAGSRAGDRLVMRGKGIVKNSNGQHGNQYVHLDIDVPQYVPPSPPPTPPPLSSMHHSTLTNQPPLMEMNEHFRSKSTKSSLNINFVMCDLCSALSFSMTGL
jgi:hypothetical protein